jgi:hypothetical protein
VRGPDLAIVLSLSIRHDSAEQAQGTGFRPRQSSRQRVRAEANRQTGGRYVGRDQGHRNRSAPPGKPRNQHHNPVLGTAFLHTVLDDHSHVAYAEVHDDETAATAIGVLRRAVAWFAARGVTVQRVLSVGTVRPIARTPGATPAPSGASSPSGRGPTGHRPTERFNARRV